MSLGIFPSTNFPVFYDEMYENSDHCKCSRENITSKEKKESGILLALLVEVAHDKNVIVYHVRIQA